MSPLHPDAVGSYGSEAEKWLLTEMGVTLRWWQRIATRRQLEHDADGKLVWQNIIESTPRRSGKSVRLRSMAIWRAAHADLFGEQQLALHTGKDLPICKEIHRRAWGWADQHGWAVRRQAGNEEIEAPDGSRWIVRGKGSVYGYDVTLGMVDEAWGVDSYVVDEGLEPALLERIQPQLVLTSTAHRQATSLMRRRLDSALLSMGEDWSTLLLLWSAPDNVELTDEAGWRAASPHWSESRRALIAGKLDRAMHGEADPELDDPDPLEGFKAQYLNIWPSAVSIMNAKQGTPVFEEAEWARLDGGTLSAPTVAAIEAWFSDGLAVVFAEARDKQVLVSAQLVETAAEAAQLVSGIPVLCLGKSLLRDPAFMLLPAQGMSGTARNAAMDLRRLVDEGILLHDSSEALTQQVLELRTVPAADGPRMRSSSRADAVKAAAWAAVEARTMMGMPAIF